MLWLQTATSYSPGAHSQMAAGFTRAGRANSWFQVPVRTCAWEQDPLTSVVSGHKCLFLCRKRIFEAILGPKCHRHSENKFWALLPTHLSAFGCLGPRDPQHTLQHGGLRFCTVPVQNWEAPLCLHAARNACDPSLTAFPNACINIIYEGCLGQNGPCNRTFEMFFQAL